MNFSPWAFRFPRGMRYSLRTFLILITLFSLTMGTWSIYVQPYRDQAVAQALVTQCQGKFTSVAEAGSPWHRWLVVSLLGKDKFVRVLSVDLRGAQSNNEVLQAIGKFRFLRFLYLDRTPLDSGTMSTISSLSHLRLLSLRYAPVTAQGVTSLSKLGELEQLFLTGTDIADDVIPKLSELTNLQKLYLRWTAISQQGVERLRSSLPSCKIYYHPLAAASEK